MVPPGILMSKRIVYLSGNSAVKNPFANVGDSGSISGSGRCPGETNGNPPQHSSWRIPWTEEPGRLHSMGSQRVGLSD